MRPIKVTQVMLPEKGEKIMGPEWRKEGTDDLSELSIVVTHVEVEKSTGKAQL